MPVHIALVGFLKKPQKNKGDKKAHTLYILLRRKAHYIILRIKFQKFMVLFRLT